MEAADLTSIRPRPTAAPPQNRRRLPGRWPREDWEAIPLPGKDQHQGQFQNSAASNGMPRPRLHHPQIRQSVFKNPFQSSPFGHAIPRRAAGMGTNSQGNRSIPTFQSSLQQGGYALSVLRHAQRAIGIGIHQIILHINTWIRRQFQGYGRPSLGNAHAVGQRAVGIIQTIAGKHAGGPVRPQQLPAQRQIQTDSQRSLNNSPAASAWRPCLRHPGRRHSRSPARDKARKFPIRC